MEQWLSRLQSCVADASMVRSGFPVIFVLDRIASSEEVHDAFRAAREVDKRIVAVAHEVDYSQPSSKSVFTVRLGMPDPNPPPFLEQHPISIEVT